jgi:hypothetical protein
MTDFQDLHQMMMTDFQVAGVLLKRTDLQGELMILGVGMMERTDFLMILGMIWMKVGVVMQPRNAAIVAVMQPRNAAIVAEMQPRNAAIVAEMQPRNVANER